MDKLIRRLVRRYKTNNPFIIAQAIGIHVRFADLGDSTRGIYYKKVRRRFIVIHNSLSEEWQRFVCAHELGHDRLHPGINRFWLEDHSFYHPGKFETQANRFAIRLLTNGDEPDHGDSIGELLQRNGVPVQMEKFY